ncbi:MAG: helix-turn-helix domain-containing protein [Bacteroidota bacterium]|jgi:transcriptional regulator with XRE-family HTH domain|nr:helix-turn-helix transcriptional regulator [Cytophagales bacterium]MCE2956671.1 helix-turn-helix transcriptional regulator [Flammeovirgaceae bacterium]MCZ8069353.1 helix-turn-helix transcriptional regulator [Cytophagales bacterium]
MKTFLSNLSCVLKKLRLDRQYSQENIAYQIGLSPSGYGKIERGQADLTISRIEQIANVFGLTASQIISMADKYNLPDDEMANQIQKLKNDVDILSSCYLRLQADHEALRKKVEDMN